MSENNSTTIALLVVILFFIIINLSVTAFLVFRPTMIQTGAKVIAQPSLPTGLDTADGRRALFERLRQPFNLKDYQGLYEILDEAAQIQISIETLESTIDSIYLTTGRIESGAYSHFVIQDTTSTSNTYNLYYLLRTEKGQGTMQVTVLVQGNEPYRVLGLSISQN